MLSIWSRPKFCCLVKSYRSIKICVDTVDRSLIISLIFDKITSDYEKTDWAVSQDNNEDVHVHVLDFY